MGADLWVGTCVCCVDSCAFSVSASAALKAFCRPGFIPSCKHVRCCDVVGVLHNTHSPTRSAAACLSNVICVQARKPDVWRQLARLLPSIRAEQEELGAEDCGVASEDPDIVDDSDNAWYNEWVNMNSDLEEGGPPTDLSGASEDESGSEAGDGLSVDADGESEEM